MSGIVLFTKPSGCTSFSSLSVIKRALNTKKVGHTGTLDSFADGLLVVLIGNLTRFAPYITAFDKTYDALIEFGAETDTLDPLGTVIKTGRLPTKSEFEKAVEQWTGEIMQEPPSYSALHVNGLRASDIARKGGIVQIKPRPVTVFDSQIISVESIMDSSGEIFIKSAYMGFSVSKGTYIRSLARDIAHSSNSCAYLSALRRLSVGQFRLEEAAGYQNLPPFIQNKNTQLSNPVKNPEYEEIIKNEILNKIQNMNGNIAVECGMKVLKLKKEYELRFCNGQKLEKDFFVEDMEFNKKQNVLESCEYAVFTMDGNFAGVVKENNQHMQYGFVSGGL